MLLINGENVKLPAYMIDEVKREYGLEKGQKGIIRVFIDARHKQKSKTDPRREIKPAGFMVPAKESNVLAPMPKTTKAGNPTSEDVPSEIIYFTQTMPHPDIKGEVIYTPSLIEIRDGMVVYNNCNPSRPDTGELLYFLHYCSRQNRTGTSFDPNSASVFFISNPAKEAGDLVAAKRQKSKIDRYLFETLQPNQLKEIAGAFGILGTGEMSNDMIIVSVDAKLNDSKEGAKHRKLFLELAENYGKGGGMVDKSVDARKYVTTCIDLGIIGLDQNTGQWRWKSDSGQFENPIMVVRNLLDRDAAAAELAEHLVSVRGEFDFSKMEDAYKKVNAE